MNPVWRFVGILAYFVTWPALFVYFLPSQRTRVILFKDGKVLCQKGWYSNGRWLLPGGGLKRGEAVVSGAIREVYEETGLRLEPMSLRVLGSFRTRRGFRYRYHVLICSHWGSDSLRPGAGMYETSWVDLSVLVRPGMAEESARASIEQFAKSERFDTLDRGE